jgi:probable HAF family extracellular repeat protein
LTTHLFPKEQKGHANVTRLALTGAADISRLGTLLSSAEDNMKSKTLASVTASFVGLAITVGLAGQEQPATRETERDHRGYRFIDLGTLGGPNSGINCCGILPPTLNNQGTAVGVADASIPNPNFGTTPNPLLPPDPFVNVAVVWHGGIPRNLGALPGGYNSFANAIAADGAVVGYSETDDIDPLLGVVEVHPTLWRHGHAIDLGTFGGGEGTANQSNNHGQVVGFATNTTPESFPGPIYGFLLATQQRAFLWQKGVLQDLGTLGTGNDAQAVFINDRGQIAGASYTNATANPATGIPTQVPFFWDDGTMVNLGTLGGVYGAAAALNNHGQVAGNSDLASDSISHAFLWDRKGGMKDIGTLGGTFAQADGLTDAGEVVGASTLPGDQPPFHAFLWKNGAMTDLGTLPGDCSSGAYAINSKRQIVGDSFSCDFVTHPFLWEDSKIINLQAFVPPASGFTLSEPSFINDRGEIFGYGFLSNGDENGFLLIPCDQDHPGLEDCVYDPADAVTVSEIHPVETAHLASPTAAGSKLSPAKMLTRFRSMTASHHHRFGALQRP